RSHVPGAAATSKQHCDGTRTEPARRAASHRAGAGQWRPSDARGDPTDKATLRADLESVKPRAW
ncbi:MAG: hypothetical protein ACK54L_09535, partial [Betaproteobacteria bacterium]